MTDLISTSTAAAMVALVGSWSVAALTFISIGALAFSQRAAPIDGSKRETRLDAILQECLRDPALQLLLWFWEGWAIVVVLLQCWHLALPIDDRALLCVELLAATALGFRARLIVTTLRSLQRPGPTFIAGAAVLVLLIANVAAGPITNYDTGLYHLQAVRWNCDYAIVPGLANLHGRLGFNNASFLYAALFDAGPWTGGSHHVVSGVLLLSVLLTSLASFDHLLRNRSTAFNVNAASRSHLFRVMLFAPALLTNYNNITSPSPDLPANLLGVVLAMLLADIALRRRDGLAQPSHLAAVTLLASIGVAVKLSFLPFGLAAFALAWHWQRRATKGPIATNVCATGLRPVRDRPAILNQARHGLAIVASLRVPISVACAVLVPWTIRGIVLSGYPIFPATVFPATAFPVQVDWRVPQQRAADEAAMIVHWARTRSVLPGRPGVAWVPEWAAHQAKDFLKVDLPLAIAIGCVAIVLLRRTAKTKPTSARIYWLLAAPPLSHLVFLLCTAPDLSRFGGASFWLLAILATLAWLDAESLRGTPRVANRLAMLTTGILALVALGKVADRDHLTGPGGLRPIPEVPLTARTMQSGAVVFVPKRSDQAWAAPLPSTPDLAPSLELREPDNHSAGFRIKQALP
jgi:hypothetical protein